MRICVAQIKSDKGNISGNIASHKKWIKLALSNKVDFIAFPELSLTGYEPTLAKELAMDISDSRLDEFQQISDLNNLVIGLGAPTQSGLGIHISMLIFQPNQHRKVYSKQLLHADELPYFAAGNEQLLLTVNHKKIAPAICYESLQEEHSKNANHLGADIYLASVAKPQKGVEKAFTHYPKTAEKYAMPILMANTIGFCHDFKSAGHSAVWNSKGKLTEKLGADNEGLLLFDTDTEEVNRVKEATT